jgi:DMSO/TMAO reductase YedYZ molybdopterin-dependent catalytic subunit
VAATGHGTVAPRQDDRVDGARLRPGLAGAVAAIAAIATSELVAGLWSGGRSIVLAVGDRVIELTPGEIVRFAIATFGKANRAVLLASMAVVAVAAGVAVGIAAARRRPAAPAGMAAFALLGAGAALADPLLPTATAVAAPVAGAGIGTAALLWLLHAASSPARAGDAAVAMPGVGIGTRRAFLVRSASVLGAAVVAGVAGRTLQLRSAVESVRETLRLPRPARPLPAPGAGTSLDVAGLSPLFTPNSNFYRIDTALTVPRIDPDTHVVRVIGLVDRPFEITYRELLQAPQVEADVTLSCVSNEVGGGLVGTARWQGVPLATLLDRAGVQPGASQVVGRAVDGWTAGFPLDVVYDGRPALVAVGMNGEPLPVAHGFPIRLVVAGLYGYVSDTKWLAEIELTTFDGFDGYWIPRGWAKEGPIKTQSRIDVPRDRARVAAGPTPIAGVAWAGTRGISRVEVSIDDGPWQPARLSDELAATSWRQWVLPWDATSGQHTIRVRATDGTGATQTPERSRPAPSGATGHHTVTVTVG